MTARAIGAGDPRRRRPRWAKAGRRGRAAAVVAIVAAVGLAGCGSGKDAVAQGGTFDFVSPGGKTDIFYDPPSSRGAIGNLSGPDLVNSAVTDSVAQFAGKVVVVNLWGSWCGPCRTEAPQLENAYAATEHLGVAFLGVDVRDDRQAAQDFVTSRRVNYPSIFDPAMRSLIALGGKFPTSVIPSTLVLDRHRRVAAVFLRAILASDLQPVIERVAAEK